jgi:hypothetical protein
MKVKINAALATLATFASLQTYVYAQTPAQIQPGNVTLKGDSLVNINHRNSQNDFNGFFLQPSSDNNSASENSNLNPEALNQNFSSPDIPLIVQPATQTVDGNDGVQVQLDLSNPPK